MKEIKNKSEWQMMDDYIHVVRVPQKYSLKIKLLEFCLAKLVL